MSDSDLPLGVQHRLRAEVVTVDGVVLVLLSFLWWWLADPRLTTPGLEVLLRRVSRSDREPT